MKGVQIQDGTLVHRLIICGIIDRGTESEYETRTHSDHPVNVFPCVPIPTTSCKLQVQPKPIRGSRMQERFSWKMLTVKLGQTVKDPLWEGLI